jgi:CCR4-NOT transcription complex subunit 1
MDLFRHFNIKLVYKPSQRMKEHLIKYIIDYEGFQRQIISSALDFSVREVYNKIVKTSICITKITALSLFKTREELIDTSTSGNRSLNSLRFFSFRNLLVNLTRSTVHFTSQEPLKASLCGNITHFLKLSSNDLPIDEVNKISLANLKICCSLVEKVAITQANEIAPSLYNKHLKSIDKMSNSESKSCLLLNNIKGLKILTDSVYVEKKNIRSIENSEYQEIRSFLM